jgi:hypothetical protein
MHCCCRFELLLLHDLTNRRHILQSKVILTRELSLSYLGVLVLHLSLQRLRCCYTPDTPSSGLA